MKTRTFVAVCTTALLTVGLSVAGVAGIASADDTSTTSTSSASGTSTTDGTTTAPAATPTDAPTAAPVVVATTTTAPVTAAADTTNAYVAVSWNIAGGNASAPWTAPGQSIATHTVVSSINLAALEASDPVTCGTAKQYDIYYNDANTAKLVTDAVAGTKLTGPSTPDTEDLVPGGSGVAYAVVQGAVCPPPVIGCTATSTFTVTGVSPTSDGISDEGDRAPHQSATGYLFGGPGVVDLYAGLNHTGTLNSINSFGYTIVPGTNGQPAQLVLEVALNAPLNGGTVNNTYATLSTNLPTGFSGSVDALALTGNSAFSTTKILSGPGSLSQPEPFSWFQTNFPKATLLQVGLHLLSGSSATDISTVSEVHLGSTGHPACVSTSFVPVPPTTPTVPSAVKTGNAPFNPAIPAGLALLAAAMFLFGSGAIRKARTN